MKNIKNILSSIQFFLLTAVLLLSTPFSWAVTSSYYSNANGKSGENLRDALNTITSVGPSGMSYDKLWTAYKTTDVYPTGHVNAGKIWDMYSDCIFTYSTSQCGNYSNICDCYNREHSLPKSWFNEATPMYYDLGHIVPTDGKVNSYRSNYPFGEVNSGTTYQGGSKLGSAKSITISNTIIGSGSSTQSCSSSKVFEPVDDYKGDFARMYMYMRVRYKSTNFTQEANGGYHFTTTYTKAGYYGMTGYSVALLMKWHRQDPVSQKEIDRNNAMETAQGNRNPFIDYPCLAEYLWGEHADETFNLSDVVGSFESGWTAGSSGCASSTSPTLSVSPTTLTMSATAGGSSTATFTITGANLTGSISITNTSGSGFSINPTSISAANANGTNTITVIYSPSAEGTHSATYSIASTGATSVTVTVNGTCAATRSVTWKVNNSAYTTGNPTTSVASGSKVTTLPTNPSVPSGCSGKTFVGWTATAITTETNTRPTDLFTTAAGSPTITANTTFHAVFATQSGSGSASISKASSISAGDKVVFVCEDASMELTSFSSTSTIYGIGESYSGTPTGTMTFDVVAGNSTGTYAFQNGSIYVNWSSGNSLSTAATKNANSSWSVSISGGNATITNGSDNTRQIWWNVGSPRFACYTGKTAGSSYYAIQLYKVTGGISYSGYITQCSAVTYVTLSFNANGGSGTMSDQSVPSGVETAINPCTFTRSGYTFAGWAESANGSVVYTDGANITISSNKTLYAKWTQVTTHTITWSIDGSTTSETYTDGQTLTIPTPSNCTGGTRVFKGWTKNSNYTSNDGSGLVTPTSPVTADATYYAVYADATTTGGGSSTASVTFSAQGYSDQTAVTSVTMDNCTLTFDKGTNSNAPKYYTSGSAIRVYGSNTCTITSTSGNISQIVITFGNNDGSNAITANVGTYSSGTWTGSANSVIFTVGGTSGNRRFAGMSVTTGGGTTTYSNYSTSCTTTPTTYNITYKDQGGGTFSGTHGSGYPTTHTYGTATTLVSPTKTGYDFGGWFTTSACTGTAVTTLGATAYTADITLYAKWTAKSYNITYKDQGNATFSGTHGSGYPTTHTYGTTTTLVSPTKTGYTFGGWFTTSACTGTAVTALGATAYTADITLYAKWTQNTYNFTIAATPNGYGSVSTTSITGIPHGSSVTINGNKFTVNGTTVTATPATATAQYTYAFSQWNNLPTTVTANVTNVQAVFTRTTNTYTVTFNANGHGTAPSAITDVEYNSTITSPTEPTATGWTFGGWYKESGCTNAWNFSSDKVTGNTILYAKWTAKPMYAVTFMDGTSTYDTKSGYEGQTIAVTDPTPCSGFTFVGWSTQQYSSDNTATPTIDYNGTVPSGNTTYYAVYSIQKNPTTTLTNNYAPITSLDDLSTGNYLVVGNYNTNSYAMRAATTGTYYLNQTQVYPSSNVISSPAANLIWQITVDESNNITLFNNTKFVYASRPTSSQTSLTLTQNATGIYFTPSVSGTIWTFTSNSYNGYKIRFNGTNTTKRFELSNSTANIYLYKQQTQTTYTTYYTTDTSFTIIANPNNTTYGSTSITEL